MDTNCVLRRVGNDSFRVWAYIDLRALPDTGDRSPAWDIPGAEGDAPCHCLSLLHEDFRWPYGGWTDQIPQSDLTAFCQWRNSMTLSIDPKKLALDIGNPACGIPTTITNQRRIDQMLIDRYRDAPGCAGNLRDESERLDDIYA